MTKHYTKQELLQWIAEYYKTEQPLDREVEEQLTKSFGKNKQATMEEMVELIKWKFDDKRNKNRRITELNHLKTIPEQCITIITKKAFESGKSDEVRVELIKTIKGFGNAVCSVALTFYNPKKYCVFDIHAWRELFGHEKNAKDYDSTAALLRFFEEIRKISKETGLTCREVEKAIFTKNYLETKKVIK
jgi:thermostable 8-oxoguanine DNA glycosylase